VPLRNGGLSFVSDPSDTKFGGTEEPSRYAIVNYASLPASLGKGQKVGIEIGFTANAVGRFGAELLIGNSASPSQVILHGIGTAGLGGSNEPSLARILRAYDIPTIVGEGHDDDNEADSVYPQFPDPSSQEVPMQVLQKAGAGPVTITDLADFTDAALQPAYGFGYYTPNQPADRTQLFVINDSDAQSVDPHPVGSTSFDPGSSHFGLYFESSIKDKGQRRLGYSQDVYNTWDTTQQHKFRFFPLENPNGSVVANAYIVTTTEFNAPIGYNFHNIVAIIRNVKPAATLTITPTPAPKAFHETADAQI